MVVNLTMVLFRKGITNYLFIQNFVPIERKKVHLICRSAAENGLIVDHIIPRTQKNTPMLDNGGASMGRDGVLPLGGTCGRDLLGPGAGEEAVDQGGDVADVGQGVLVAVGIGDVDAVGVAAQQIVDQGGNVADVDLAVIVHVAAQDAAVLGQ